MNLNIHIPNYCTNEMKWIIEVIFGEFLGVEYEIVESEEKGFIVASTGKKLKLQDTFFFQAKSEWLQASSLPQMLLETLDVNSFGLNVPLVTQEVPVLFGGHEIELSETHINLGVDIFGSSFFMLSRYEELVIKTRDKHDRFPATASVAYMAGFLERPIINEYIEILWALMKYLWPELERKKRRFRNLITCDVDFPYDTAAKSFYKTVIRVGARVVRDRNYSLAVKDGVNYFTSKFGCYYFDDYYNNLKWIMDVNEEEGNKVASYFIPQ